MSCQNDLKNTGKKTLNVFDNPEKCRRRKTKTKKWNEDLLKGAKVAETF